MNEMWVLFSALPLSFVTLSAEWLNDTVIAFPKEKGLGYLYFCDLLDS